MKAMRLHTLIIAAAIALVACAVGLLGFAALRYHEAWTKAESQLVNLRSALANNSTIYGEFETYDPATRTLALTARNRYDPAGAPESLRYAVDPQAFIGFQELLYTPQGAVLSTTTAASSDDLSSLRPGTRLKLVTANTRGSVSIIHLLFGNPL